MTSGGINFGRRARGNLPAWAPAEGHAVRYVAGAGVLTNNFRNVVAPWFEDFYDCDIVGNSYSGQGYAPDLGSHGSVIFAGGGHSATHSGQVTALVSTPSELTFRRMSDPTAWSGSRATDSTTRASNSFTFAGMVGATDAQWIDAKSTVDAANTQPQPPGIHSYASVCIASAAHGGAAHGTYFQLFPVAAAVGNLNGVSQHDTFGGSHEFAINSDTDPTANTWSRAGSLPGFTTSGWSGPTATALVPHQQRFYYTASEAGTKLRWFDRQSGQHVQAADGTNFTLSDLNTGQLIFVPSRGARPALLLYVARGVVSSQSRLRVQWANVSAATGTPTVAGYAALSTEVPLPAYSGTSAWACAWWCEDSNRLIVGAALDAPGGSFDNAFFELAIPDDPSVTWTVTRRAILGSAAIDWSVYTWSTPVYLRAARTMLLMQSARTTSNGSADSVIAYRPYNT